MNWRVDFKGWRFYIALNHSVKVKGVNSKLPDYRHFLMWDFDDKGLDDVRWALQQVQKDYKLSKIYLVNTGLDRHWHAYCFKRHSWGKTLDILASTFYLDQMYFKIGVIRGYFTLRYQSKRDRDFKAAIILPSPYKEDVNPFELNNFCRYWTKRV